MSDTEEIKRRLAELESTDKEIVTKLHENSEVLREMNVTNKYLQENITELSNVKEEMHKLDIRVSRNDDFVRVAKWFAGVVVVSLVGLATKLVLVI